MNIKSYYENLRKVFEEKGTCCQIHFDTKEQTIIPCIETIDDAKELLRKYKMDKFTCECKKFKTDTITKHNGNAIIKITDGVKKYSFEFISCDLPFDNRFAKRPIIKKEEPKKEKKFTSNVELISEDEFKKEIQKEIDIKKSNHTDMLMSVLESFDLYAHINLTEDFDYKKLFNILKSERNSEDKFDTKDFILDNISFDIDDCCRNPSLEFIKNIKEKIDTIHDELSWMKENNLD